jgi:MFS family permease
MLPRTVAISPDDGSEIDLRNPALAALLSWLVPGLGQCYQGRSLKGGLFMGSLLAALVFGLWLGGGRVVYASWRPGETRLAFLGQAGIGAVAIPALLQSARLHGPARQPWLASPWFAPPLRAGQLVTPAYATVVLARETGLGPNPFGDQPPLRQCRFDQLSAWHARLGRFFEIGTLYTVLAGMLNLLVVYDAWAGPFRDARGKGSDDETGREEGSPTPAQTGAGGKRYPQEEPAS